MITVIMLNYRRTSNIFTILRALSEQTIKPIIWLWNNSGTKLGDQRIDMEITADKNLHCWPRWFLATYAATDAVMMIDDDILPRSESLIEIALHALYSQQSADIIVGAEGVILGTPPNYWPAYAGRVARNSVGDVEGSVHVKKVLADERVDIVKGRCLVARTQSLKSLSLSPAHRDMCDDIVVSALLAKGRMRPHLVSADLGKVLDDLPDADPEVALSRRSNWRDLRDSARAHYFDAEAAS